jgi:hypothetical protein
MPPLAQSAPQQLQDRLNGVPPPQRSQQLK